MAKETPPQLSGTSIGTVATAGAGGTFLILIARSLGDPVLQDIVTVLAPGLSSLAIWLLPHIRLRIVIAYHQRTIHRCKQVLARSALPPKRKQRIQRILDNAEERLLEWQLAYFPREDFDPKRPVAPQLKRNFNLDE